MNLNELFSVSAGKVAALRAKMDRLGVDPRQIDETFVKGGGKGGQKINKTANAVVLVYRPLNLTVRCQRERQRNLNRFLALRELVDQIELQISPETSSRRSGWERIRKQKDRRRRRVKG